MRSSYAGSSSSEPFKSKQPCDSPNNGSMSDGVRASLQFFYHEERVSVERLLPNKKSLASLFKIPFAKPIPRNLSIIRIEYFFVEGQRKSKEIID